MGKIFYFQKCEWKYILFLLFFIFSFLQTAIIRWISMNSKDIAQPFLNTYLFTVSDYLAVIPYIIVFLRSRKLNQTIEIREKYSLPRNKDNKRKKEFFLLITLVTVFDFASHISSLLFYIVYGRNERSINENYLSSLLIFNTVIIYLLSRLILKTYFYKHHYFSFIINVVCILILGTIDIVYGINSKDNGPTGMVIFYIVKKILSIVFYAIEDVIGKKLLIDTFIGIYGLLFYRAVFGTVLIFLFSIPFMFIEVTDTSKVIEGTNKRIEETGIIFKRILNLFNDLNFFKIIMFIITNLFYNIFIWLIIDKFSPSHYSISLILESFGTLIRLWISEPDTVDLPVLRMFIYIILIFGSFIHTEMVVINYCDLQKNTKLFLDELAKEDIYLINNLDESGPFPLTDPNQRNSSVDNSTNDDDDENKKEMEEMNVYNIYV